MNSPFQPIAGRDKIHRSGYENQFDANHMFRICLTFRIVHYSPNSGTLQGFWWLEVGMEGSTARSVRKRADPCVFTILGDIDDAPVQAERSLAPPFAVKHNVL